MGAAAREPARLRAIAPRSIRSGALRSVQIRYKVSGRDACVFSPVTDVLVCAECGAVSDDGDGWKAEIGMDDNALPGSLLIKDKRNRVDPPVYGLRVPPPTAQKRCPDCAEIIQRANERRQKQAVTLAEPRAPHRPLQDRQLIPQHQDL